MTSISTAVHEKNKDIARKLYGTKIAKELRKVFKRAWLGQATSKEIYFVQKRAKESLQAKGA